MPLYNPATSSGSTTLTVRTVTSSDSVVNGDDVILVDASGGAVTLTLPAANSFPQKALRIKKVDSSVNKVTLNATIDGVASRKLCSYNESVTITTNSSAYYFVEHTNVLPWESYTATGSFSTNVTYTARKRRNGPDLEMSVKLSFSGATDAASFTLNLPTDHTIDTTPLASTSALSASFPSRCGGSIGGTIKEFGAVYNSTTVLSFRFNSASGNGTTGNVSNTTLGTVGNGDEFSVWVKVPIVDWW
jgi:hypothetical protein